MRRTIVAAFLVMSAIAVTARAETRGPAFGANAFTTSIDTVNGVEDADDYVAPLASGEKLTVTLATAKGAALLPALTFLGPDGAAVPVTVVEKKAGKSLSVKNFVITATGKWTVRVTGKTGTQGGYTITFKIGKAKDVKLTKQHLGGADPLARDVAFEGLEAALLDVTVTWPKRQSVVHIGAVRDPSGGENSPGTAPVEKPTSSKMTKRALHTGYGTYIVPLSIDSGECTYTVVAHVVPQGRPAGKKPVVLSASEPFLDIPATPVRGDAGLTAHFTGTGFPVSPAPQVLFGGVPGTSVVVASDGKSLDVVVPQGAAGSKVEVAVVQADGQSSVRADAFVYVPLPTITDLVDASSTTVTGGSTAGGAALKLVGTGFLTGHVVKFGGVECTGVSVPDASHVALTTPPIAAGMASVTLEDEFARVVTASFQYEYKTPPAFAQTPYSQVFAPTAGGVTITITGTGFESADQLKFNGANLSSSFVDATTRTFTSPAIAAGSYAVAIVDRFGSTATGPNFTVKNAPAFAATPYSPAFGPVSGGVLVTVTGTGFESTDVLKFNGTTLQTLFVSATTVRFSSPAMANGSYSITLTDRFNQTGTGPNFTVKDAPAFAAIPYSPAFATPAGGTLVTITGSGFESTDSLGFNGSVYPSTFVNATTRRFTTPAIAAGSYTVTLIDRFSQISSGPNFTVKDPPAFAANPYSPAFAGTAGGTTVTITGTGFQSADQLKFNGSNLTSTFVNSTTRTFSSPAIAAGSYSIALVDAFGVSVSGPSFIVKDPPTFGATPYSPVFANTAGGTTVTISGGGFESSDQLRFNGSNINSTFVSSTTRTFVTPAIAAGSYAVALVDSLGQVSAGPTFPVKDPPTFASSPYAPSVAAVSGGTSMTLTGTGFESQDQLKFDGSNVTSAFVNSTTRTFTVPSGTAGFHTVSIVDRFGQTANGPSLALSIPTISAVAATGGAHIGATKIAAGGGAAIEVTGTAFVSGFTVTLGGTSVTVGSVTPTQIVFTAPSGSFGTASLVVTDSLGNSATSNALSYVGYDDMTTSRQPGTSSTDNFIALRGAIGDLDNDGAADDLVITDYYGGYHGSQAVYTRILFEQSGTLADVTSTNFPGVPSWGDVFAASAVAIGDVDGDTDQDVMIAGSAVFVYNPYTTNYYTLEARTFVNDGSGTFTQTGYTPLRRTWDVTCTDAYGGTYTVFRHGYSYSSSNTLALGDLDGDGDNEVVICKSHYSTGYAYINPQYVTFTPGAYYDPIAGAHYQGSGTYYYTPCTRVFDNQGSNGFVDVTFPRIPLCGNYPSYLPAFPARDVKLGDIDGDPANSLDIVMTWNDPYTTTPHGQWTSDVARISTSILINDGSGFFSDQTSTWMPAASYPEFWQGNRCELADLDADGKKDLVVLHQFPLDGFTTTTSSLRVLQNTGSAFSDVTSTALPSVPLSGTADDNLRGNALAVKDVDGDGHLDIVVGTTESLFDSSGNQVRSTRLLIGDGSLHFTLANEFLPAVSVDTGETTDLLIGDLAGNPEPSLFLLSQYAPTTSTNGERLRVLDWK